MEPDYIDALDHADSFADETQTNAITRHGFDDRTSPVDALMAGGYSMGLAYAAEMAGDGGTAC